MGNNTIPTFGVQSNVAKAADSGQTIDSQGVVFDPNTTFWSPFKMDKTTGTRFVPGMGNGQALAGWDVLSGQANTFNNAPTGTTHPYHGGAFGGSSEPDHTPQGQSAFPPGTGTAALGTAPLSTGVTIASAMNHLLEIGSAADPSEIQALQEQMIRAGFLDPSKRGFDLGSISGTHDPTYTAYYQLLETSIRTGTNWKSVLDDRAARDAGKKYEDVLARQKARQAKADALLGPHTATSTHVDLSDPLAAQGLLTKALTNELGRAPTTDEISQYTAALTAAQTAAPTTTSAFIDPTDPAAALKSSTTSGGLDTGQFTENYVNQNFGQEKNAVGEATGFYQAAMQALGPGGR